MILFRGRLEEIQRTYVGRPFDLVFWNGERWRFGAAEGAPEFVVKFKTRSAFVRSMLQTTLGLGEGYVAGEVLVEGDLEDALTSLFEIGLREPAVTRSSVLRERARGWVGSAVARSRVKRLLREVFRRHRARLPYSLDVVLLPQGPPRTYAEYLSVYERFLEKLEARLTPCVPSSS